MTNTFHYEDLNFQIPPAAELFPDTYDHALDKTFIYICILNPTQPTSNNVFQENALSLIESLKLCGYDTSAKQLTRKRFTTIQDLQKFLGEVKTTDFFDCSAVLLFWFGETDEDGSNGLIALKNEVLDIRDLWKPFVQEEQLLGKPKINMFFVIITYLPLPPTVQTDSCPNPRKPRDPYETPEEADVLIIYQKTDMKKTQASCVDATHYVKTFANNFVKFGRQYHICNLAFTDIKMNHKKGLHYPIVVSTLTRKFFIQPSHHRGIHLELDELTKEIQHNMNIMLQGGTGVQVSTYLHKWKKRAGVTRRSTNTAPPTPQRQSKDTLLSDPNQIALALSKLSSQGKQKIGKADHNAGAAKAALISKDSLPQPSTSAKTGTTVSQTTTPSRSRLSSVSQATESKPKWNKY